MTLRTIKGIGGLRRRRHSIRTIVALGALAGVLGMTLPASANTPTGNAQYSYIDVADGDSTYNGARDVLVYGNYVYWTNTASGRIGRADTNDPTTANQSFITGLNAPSGLATDGTSLYWSNAVDFNNNTSAIGKTALDGSGVPNKTFITGASRPIGLAVDAGFIYWANYGTKTIGRATITGASINQSFINVAGRPFGLAVDATHIFYANFDENAGTGVGRAAIDGSGVTAAFIPTSSAPTGLAVDATHVYWSNYSSNTIGRANLDATSPDQNWLTGATGPVGIDINATHLYWSNYDLMPPKVGRTAFDFTAPSILGPSSFTTLATTLTGGPVTYGTAVSATDADDLNIVPSCSFGTLTGGTFPLGNTVVTCNAADPVGNSSTKMFTVTVNLPPPPVLTLSPNLNVTATSLSGAIVTYAAPTSTSGSPTCSTASGTQFAIGVATVMCSATDPTGQTTAGSFTITVTKPGFPTFSPNPLPNQIVTATSPAGAVVTYATPTASAGTPSCAPVSGATFPIGMTTVTCSTTDNLAQTTTATFMVTVNKPAAPVLTLPSNRSATATSAAGVAITYPAATATSGTPTCTPVSGSVFPVGVTTVTCTATDGFAQTTTGTFTVSVAPVPAPVAATPPATGNPAAEPTVAAVAATTTVAPTTTVTPTTIAAPVATTKPVAASTPTTTAPIVAVVAPSTKVLPATAVIEEPTFTG